jgi:hypothetical protein
MNVRVEDYLPAVNAFWIRRKISGLTQGNGWVRDLIWLTVTISFLHFHDSFRFSFAICPFIPRFLAPSWFSSLILHFLSYPSFRGWSFISLLLPLSLNSSFVLFSATCSFFISHFLFASLVSLLMSRFVCYLSFSFFIHRFGLNRSFWFLSFIFLPFPGSIFSISLSLSLLSHFYPLPVYCVSFYSLSPVFFRDIPE